MFDLQASSKLKIPIVPPTVDISILRGEDIHYV
jgi:hypothetical protein